MTDESKSKVPENSADHPAELLEVESLDIDAQGIAHKPDGKVVFIEGALPRWCR